MKKEIIFKDRILQDFKKKQKFNLLFFIIIDVIILILIAISRFYFKGIVSEIINIIILLFFIYLTAVKYIYYFKTSKYIKKGKYEIKKDKVENVDNDYNKDSYNDTIAVKFTDYNNIVHLSKKIYNSIKKEESFYLVFVNNDITPINYYSANDFKLEK